MATVREKLLRDIESIKDEEMLAEVYKLVHGIIDTDYVLILNDEQKAKIARGEQDYLNGDHVSTDDLFNELLNE